MNLVTSSSKATTSTATESTSPPGLSRLPRPGSIPRCRTISSAMRLARLRCSADLGERELKNVDRPIRVWRSRNRAGSGRFWRQASGKSRARRSAFPRSRQWRSCHSTTCRMTPSRITSPMASSKRSPQRSAASSRSLSSHGIPAFAYKGRPTNVRDIGKELGVGYLLEGSVQRAGYVSASPCSSSTRHQALISGPKNMTARWMTSLICRTGSRNKWRAPCSRRSGSPRSSAWLKRPQDLGAYDFTMRAFRHVWVLEKEEAVKGLELLNRARELDRDYPLALALAAWCHAQTSVYNWTADIEASKIEALRLAERAADLSSDDPLILIPYSAPCILSYETMERHACCSNVPVALDPNAAWAWSRLGWLAVYADRPKEARDNFERALRLSPRI